MSHIIQFRIAAKRSVTFCRCNCFSNIYCYIIITIICKFGIN